MFRIIISFFYLFSKLLHFKQHVTQITSLKHQLRFNIYSIFKSYNSGDINKAKDYKTRLTKMKTHHSSTAIMVNLFQYRLGKAPCSILISPIRKNFYLLYLWYDVLGEDRFKHREEMEQQFTKLRKKIISDLST